VTGPPALIEARALAKRYKLGGADVDAVSGIDLDVAQGEWVAIKGPSGSGKSTLLNLVGGLDRPTSGSIAVGGRELGSLDSAALAKHRREIVGFVFQAFRLLAHLTARENVALPMLLAGRWRADAERRADELLERVGLAARAAHRPAQLSGGEQQRVAIARALVNGPHVLLADEPTGNLDAVAATEVLDLITALRRDGALTVLVASHDPDVAARAERIVRMRDGRVVDSASTR
jgi:putative ABC transport system ATP-binding protein